MSDRLDRVRESIAGERRHWLVVENRPDDLAALLSERDALAAVAEAVLRATDANRDALNGQGHEGPHDRDIHIEPCCAGAATNPGEFHVYDMTGDCAQCGGAQYGSEDALQQAIVDMRLALGLDLLPHEHHRAAYDRTVAKP